MNTNATYKIRPAGRHLLTIGRDLIKDNYAAVVELVKNAYDADSSDVNIEFRAFPDHREYSIVISDHGHGMSKDDVINKWLVPSTQDKVKRKLSPSGRTLQGSKGVGRYAASILGTDLFLETINEGKKTTVYLEWSDFERAQYLDDVEILVETTEVSEPHGTQLTMKGNEKFLANWKQEQFNKLLFELKKLKSPVSASLTDDEFHIKLRVIDFPEIKDIEETIQPYPFLNLFDYKISGKINKDGQGVLTYSSQRARNMTKEEISFDYGKHTACGELDIDIRVYDREADAIGYLIRRGFKDESGNYVGKNQARQILNMNNGIGVYRNGFRIRPLGDADFDWLKLNERRVQNPSLRIGSNQVIGYVQIQSEDQSNLIEKSARDGLKENRAFDQLKDITKNIIAQLESRRFKYRSKAGLSRSANKVEQDLQRLFSFNELRQSIITELTNSAVDKTTIKEVTEIINKEETNKNAAAERISEAIAVYQGQATLGKIVNVIFHEGGRPLSYFRNQIPNLEYWYKSFQKTGDPAKLEEIMTIAEGIGQNMEFFTQLFRTLDPLTAKKRGARKLVLLKKAVEGSLSVFEDQMVSHGISAKVSGPDDFQFLSWEQDIYTIFTNLIDNSLYWISEKKPSVRKIIIEFQISDDSLHYIDYRDSGPGIEAEHIKNNLIFEPDFTTKPNGTGLGLTIAREAAERNDLELEALESEEGAYFRLQPKTEDDK